MEYLLNLNYLQAAEETTNINNAILEEYKKHLDLAETTQKNYIHCLDTFIKWLNDNAIEEVSQDNIIDFKNYLKGIMKSASVNAYLTAIKNFFSWLEGKGFNNVAKRVKKERIEKGFNKDSLTSEQVITILNSIDTSSIEGIRAKAIFKLMIGTGLRVCEVVRANIEDLRVKNNCSVLYVQGKGRTDKKEYVKITPSVMAAIQEYLSVRNAKPNEPLFTSLSDRNKGQRLTTRTIQNIITGLYRKNGIISERITTHSTRHTAITLSLYNGADITKAQEMARHKDINTTMIYYHDITRLENSAEDSIEKIFKCQKWKGEKEI